MAARIQKPVPKRFSSSPVAILERDKRLRTLLAQEAARIMADDNVADFQMAKRKAAQRLGVSTTRNLPANQEIEQALQEYQRLFQAGSQPDILRQHRETALDVMRLFSQFEPRLVGPVLAGTAGQHSEIELHLYTDTAESIQLFLMHQHIPYESCERRVQFKRGEYQMQPAFRFVAGDEQVLLMVFSTDSTRQPPLSQVDGRPVQRADMVALETLLGQAAPDEFL